MRQRKDITVRHLLFVILSKTKGLKIARNVVRSFLYSFYFGRKSERGKC